MLLTVGSVLLASAYADTDKGGFSLHDPRSRPRNFGCATVLAAIALGVIAVVIAFH